MEVRIFVYLAVFALLIPPGDLHPVAYDVGRMLATQFTLLGGAYLLLRLRKPRE